MYIDDFIPTLANAADNFKAGEVYNIGGEEFRSVKELSDLILRCTGAPESLVNYLQEDKHNVVNKRPNIERARAAFGHNPRVTLEEGIPRTIDWMREVYRESIARVR
jgi:dTDP-glucose 4,6-dehydratase